MWDFIKNNLIYFLVGGAVTTFIVATEESGNRLLSGFATLIPVFTLVGYFFIGETRGGAAVGQHAWFVLLGTIASWVPYMVVVALASPVWGSRKAIGAGLLVFFVCAFGWLQLVQKMGWFQGG